MIHIIYNRWKYKIDKILNDYVTIEPGDWEAPLEKFHNPQTTRRDASSNFINRYIFLFFWARIGKRTAYMKYLNFFHVIT